MGEKKERLLGEPRSLNEVRDDLAAQVIALKGTSPDLALDALREMEEICRALIHKWHSFNDALVDAKEKVASKDAEIATLRSELEKVTGERDLLAEQQKIAATTAHLSHFGANAATDVLGGTLSPYWGSVIAGVVARAESAEKMLASEKKVIDELVAGIDKVNNEGVRCRRRAEELEGEMDLKGAMLKASVEGLARLTDRCRELEGALRKYGLHVFGECKALETAREINPAACTCGITKALGGKE